MEADRVRSPLTQSLRVTTHLLFLSGLHQAVVNSSYWNIVLKPKQVFCLEKIYLGKDVLCVLPTGYGNSLIFHLLPLLLFFKRVYAEQPLEIKLVNSVPTIIIGISPLNALMHDQIRRLTNNNSGDICITASVINIKQGDDEDEDHVVLNCNLNDRCFEKNDLENGHYNISFSHPEALVSRKYGRNLMLNKIYQDNVCTVVVEEAHCILEWLVKFW